MSNAQPQLDDGLVILFEGLDGVGKTTQLQLARDELEKRHGGVHATRYLGGTPVGEALRQVILSPVERPPETDLYISVAIQSALIKSVDEERAAGKIILIDRGPLSLAAYHIYGNGLDPELGWQYADKDMKLFRPELVILYRTDLDTAMKRSKQRSTKTDYYASKPREYFERVVKGFDEASKRYPMRFIDASQGIDKVHRETMQLIREAIDAKRA